MNLIVHNGVKLLAVILLVLLNAFFVAAELALVRIRDTQLEALAAKGNRRAKMARHIVAHIDSYISTTQFGITLASMGLGVVVEPVFRDLLEPLFELLKITSAIGPGRHCHRRRLFRELLSADCRRRTGAEGDCHPAHVADVLVGRQPVELVLSAVLSVHLAAASLVPVGAAAAGIFRGGTSQRAFGGGIAPGAWPRTAECGAAGRNIILNALDLRHRIAREVMRPRHEITAFNTGATLAECLALAEKTRYSRFPLCEDGDLDKTRGVVHIKDLYRLARERAGRRRICCRWRAS